MAEVMTVESILDADWLLQGYWTKPRFPIQTEKGAWSDVDLLAYSPDTQHLVVAESKVRGHKKVVWGYTAYTRPEYGGNFVAYDGEDYLGFLRHVPRLCEDKVVFVDFRRMVKKITLQLVSNCAISDDVMQAAVQDVKVHAQALVPSEIDLEVRLETTLDVICRIIASENKHIQGRRYGHPVIDIARELNRYMHPEIRYAGRDRKATEEFKKTLSRKLMAVLSPTVDD